MSTEYLSFMCKSYEMARDLSRFVVLSVNVKNYKNNQLYAWTHCEWFNFNMPSGQLYSWIVDVEPEVKDLKIAIVCKLNDNSVIPIPINSQIPLKEICASHIMELECSNSR